MRTHAKSFTLASAFFKEADFSAATKIYHWCRFCDDTIDDAVSDQDKKLEELRRLTKLIFDKEATVESPFSEMREIVFRYNIPSEYLFELLNGMEMDVVKNRYEAIEELELYSFRVAGTVGLMMTHVMGLYHLRSLPVAVDLGLAMQLTNISRDVKEDQERGRIYLPQTWLREAGLKNTDDLLLDPEKDFLVVKRLLQKAEGYYKSAETGLIDLPFRGAWAVGVALELYRDIGREILKKGPIALQTRTVISKPRKITLVLKASLKTLASFPLRIFKKSQPVALNRTYQFPRFN